MLSTRTGNREGVLYKMKNSDDGPSARDAFRAACANAKQYTDPGLARIIELTSQGHLEVGGEGSYIQTASGTKLLDACGGYALFSLGRLNRMVVRRVIRQLKTLPMSARILPNTLMGECAQRIVQSVPGMQYCFINSEGTMAVDAAIKFATVATGRSTFVRIQGAYHGQSLGALMLCGTEKRRAPFQEILHPDVIELPRNDLTVVERITTRVAAVFVEVVQGEAGIWPLTTEFLLAIQERCRAVGALVVIDEIQTGFGRTGTMWAFQHHPGLQPDIVTIGKAAGGGVLPVAGCLYTKEVQAQIKQRATEREREFLGPFHASTTSFSPGPCAALIATLDVIEAAGLVQNANVVGERIMNELNATFARSPIVRDVRGAGLMVGIEFIPHDEIQLAMQFRNELLTRGVLTAPALNNNQTIRLQPPLNLRLREMKQLIATATEALAATEKKYTTL